MKKITFLIALLITSFAFAQQSVIEDFESSPTISGFEGLGEAAVATAPVGSNGNSFKLVTDPTNGQPWQGAQVDLPSGIFADLTSDKTMKIDVYSTTAFSLMVKVEDQVNSTAPAAANTQSHTGSGWETLTFTFTTGSDGTATANGDYSRIVFFPNRKSDDSGWSDPKVDVTIYVDNITSVKKDTNSSGSPVTIEDFESSPTVSGFEGLGEAVIATAPAGSNGNSFKLVTDPTNGQPWQGAQVDLASGVLADLSSDKTMKVDVYSTTAFSLMVKVEDQVNSTAPAAANTQNHTGSGWETLTFTFTTGSDGTATANGDYSRVVFFPNRKSDDSGWNDPKVDVTIYVDNIVAVKKEVTVVADPEPTDAPPTPPSFASNNVMSLYSEAYTPAATISNVDWDDSIFEEVTIAGNKVLKVSGSNFIGMSLDAYLDATNMTHLHMDYWIAKDWQAGMVMNPKLSNHAAEAGETNAIDITNAIASQSEVKNWQSKDFALSGDREKIKEFLITQAGKANVYYLDNVYLYVQGTASVDTNELFNVSVSPNPASNFVNLRADETITKAEVYNILGKKVRSLNVNANSTAINISDLNAGIYLLKYEINNKVGTTKFVKQ